MTHIVTKFTRSVPDWRPRVVPVKLEDATPEQLDALKVTPSNTKVSDYVLTLAHDVESLSVRSPLFNAIMYDRGGMSRAERELGALGASMVNHCIYCAAVHADRHAKLARDESVTDELFAKGERADLNPRDRAIFDFSRKAAEAPPTAGPEDIDALRKAGLSGEEIFDLILSSALFGWANRLMHVLGDPVRQKETA
ncbi:peroxidase-related enzyme [Ruegeria sp. 2205SS24-7]|uniref:peroxidase-related enzyme n=1 Tax=Ruegeria discodermiae TaxID=3064389 RepID=UPI002740461B|nr:peroxidase-related enzyme [Ruegeria sp. 2205SS24-7]MDP5218979.1 peroxidase-related enzyme [Ruegeria sp. 2205SS24-7]